MEIMTVREAAEKWGITTRRVTEIIRSGKIEGVFKIGQAWVMPTDTEKPADERITSGKYKKRKENTGKGD